MVNHLELQDLFIEECENFLVFDLIYDNLVTGMRLIAREVEDTACSSARHSVTGSSGLASPGHR